MEKSPPILLNCANNYLIRNKVYLTQKCPVLEYLPIVKLFRRRLVKLFKVVVSPTSLNGVGMASNSAQDTSKRHI